MSSSAPPAPTLLEYYVKSGISPVHQDIFDLDRHFRRRGSLYLSLGLPPGIFQGADVLEVGPGSGHNSLFIASRKPARYVLVEPNPVAAKDIRDLYDRFERAHTIPELREQTLEDFASEDLFDIAICEGWLGSEPEERELLVKLSRKVKVGGVLVVTLISPLGLVANTLRKALCLRISPPTDDLPSRLERALPAFSPHLSTLVHMSCSHRDWMCDMVLNPAYFRICLTPEMALSSLGQEFQPFGTQPRFIRDWRWYKSMVDKDHGFDDCFLRNYAATCLNFVDHRREFEDVSEDVSKPLLAAASELLSATAAWELGYLQTGSTCPINLITSARALRDGFATISPELATSIDQALELLERDHLQPEDIGAMGSFASLFGRELIYASFLRGPCEALTPSC